MHSATTTATRHATATSLRVWRGWRTAQYTADGIVSTFETRADVDTWVTEFVAAVERDYGRSVRVEYR